MENNGRGLAGLFGIALFPACGVAPLWVERVAGGGVEVG